MPRIAAVLAGALLCGCPEPEPPPPVPLPPLARVPAAYWVEGEGTVSLGEDEVPGRLRMNYLVDSDGKVVVPTLIAWMDDLDLVVTFLGVEVDRERLRCTVLRNEGPIAGTLTGDDLVIASGAKVAGETYSVRKEDGCGGDARGLEGEAPEAMTAVHDPEGDRFALEAEFETEHEGETYTLAFEVEGHYLNRPPVAAFVFDDPDLEVLADGCPKAARANDPKGYKVALRSESWDPDGAWPEGQSVPKLLRVDLDFEHWGRSRPDGFGFVGAGREVGPVVFESGREHQLLLWVTDRRGAEARRYCQFEVFE